MDYLLFDLVAVALPALLLLAGRRDRRLLLPCVGLSALALLWTVPWDSHLVRTHVWAYSPGGVLATVASVPVEELAFVVLEVLLVAAWATRTGVLAAAPARGPRHRGTTPWLAITAVGLVCLLAGDHLRYLGLLLSWSAPVLALQHAVAGDVLSSRWPARLRTVVPVAGWLCLADRIAIGMGTWTISPRSSTGTLVAGLPVEEALFFVITVLLVTDGLLLAADPVTLRRVGQAFAANSSRAVPSGSRNSRMKPAPMSFTPPWVTPRPSSSAAAAVMAASSATEKHRWSSPTRSSSKASVAAATGRRPSRPPGTL